MKFDLQSKTPGFHTHLSEQEFPERVTAERTIRDLQRTIQLLEMEVERNKLEIARKDEKHSAAIAILKQEHAIEVKAKDDIIEKLSQRSAETSPLLQSKKLFLSASKEPRSAVPISTHKTISRISFSSRSDATSRNPVAIETIFSAPVTTPCNPVTPIASKPKQPDVSPIRPVTRLFSAAHGENLPTRSLISKTDLNKQIVSSRPTATPAVLGASTVEKGAPGRVGLRPSRHPSNKIPSLPPTRLAVKELCPRVVDPAPRRMSIAHHPPRSPPLPRFFSPSKAACPTSARPPAGNTRKRSFWDITNTNSPPAVSVTRAARRLSTAAPTKTPSLLLQVTPFYCFTPLGDMCLNV